MSQKLCKSIIIKWLIDDKRSETLPLSLLYFINRRSSGDVRSLPLSVDLSNDIIVYYVSYNLPTKFFRPPREPGQTLRRNFSLLQTRLRFYTHPLVHRNTLPGPFIRTVSLIVLVCVRTTVRFDVDTGPGNLHQHSYPLRTPKLQVLSSVPVSRLERVSPWG